ncbi:hypothetical protein [Acetanaerobacterium elongatum]|uniref:ABC-2 family transporter protein n=1 Tax=Acetanaerobacterium elongatum TaxID=258515 RepID=A0A1G9TXH3_9FIRM|nr:hypothetical protein [Acetanaerobacterium elongatum]SDM52104.1 hypothetical protein SAMN05192585_1016 [Acetanaerobacterium elongatum]
MLGKLLKYEWKATSRVFLPFYGAILLFAIVNRFFFMLNQGNTEKGGLLAIPSGLAMMVYVLAIAATFILTFVVMIQRYYKNLLGDEGYLMFTLPVTPQQNIVAKLLMSVAWEVISFLVVILSLFAMLAQADFFEKFNQLITAFYNWSVPFDKNVFIAWMVASVFVSLFSSILYIYASISIGQLFTRHKLIASFGAFIALNFVSQLVSSIIVAIIYVINPNGINIDESQLTTGLMSLFFGSILLLNILFGIGYYIISNVILNKKLNLE